MPHAPRLASDKASELVYHNPVQVLHPTGMLLRSTLTTPIISPGMSVASASRSGGSEQQSGSSENPARDQRNEKRRAERGRRWGKLGSFAGC